MMARARGGEGMTMIETDAGSGFRHRPAAARELIARRLHNQRLAAGKFRTPADVVAGSAECRRRGTPSRSGRWRCAVPGLATPT